MEQQNLFKPSEIYTNTTHRASVSPPKRKRLAPQTRASYLEFFAGSGLVAEGLREHFNPVWANDICAKKASVYASNHGEKHFHLGSVVDIRGTDLPAAQLAWASFPCQDLSLAGMTEGIHGARSGLVWEWLRIIDEMPERPPILVAENVAGLVSVAGGNHYRTLHNALSKRGYSVGAMMIDASHWVPQSRLRVFVLAVDAFLEISPPLIDVGPNWLHGGGVRKAAEGLNDFVWWRMPEPPKRGHNLSDIIEWEAPFASEETDVRNIALISPTHRKHLEDLPKSQSFVAPGYKRTRNGKQVLELRFDDIAGCLRTPRGGSSRQIVVIRKNGQLRSRLLTVRETARLMGAPETYKIPGNYNDGYKAMGDGVAVPVTKWLAKHLLLPLVQTHAKI